MKLNEFTSFKSSLVQWRRIVARSPERKKQTHSSAENAFQTIEVNTQNGESRILNPKSQTSGPEHCIPRLKYPPPHTLHSEPSSLSHQTTSLPLWQVADEEPSAPADGGEDRVTYTEIMEKHFWKLLQYNRVYIGVI